MDGNGKIGILGEDVSRNGKHLLKVFDENELVLLNKSDKCEGQVTRQNTKNIEEFSAIDFVVCTEAAERWLQKMEIDEEGLHKIKGKIATDHNTITVSLEVQNLDKTKIPKRTVWNLKAPPEKWKEYERQLRAMRTKALSHLSNRSLPFSLRYRMFYNVILKLRSKNYRQNYIQRKT